jgi:hypothetical protein
MYSRAWPLALVLALALSGAHAKKCALPFRARHPTYAGRAPEVLTELMLPMRDGVKLHTIAISPLFSKKKQWPAVIDRSPCECRRAARWMGGSVGRGAFGPPPPLLFFLLLSFVLVHVCTFALVYFLHLCTFVLLYFRTNFVQTSYDSCNNKCSVRDLNPFSLLLMLDGVGALP